MKKEEVRKIVREGYGQIARERGAVSVPVATSSC